MSDSGGEETTIIANIEMGFLRKTKKYIFTFKSFRTKFSYSQLFYTENLSFNRLIMIMNKKIIYKFGYTSYLFEATISHLKQAYFLFKAAIFL